MGAAFVGLADGVGEVLFAPTFAPVDGPADDLSDTLALVAGLALPEGSGDAVPVLDGVADGVSNGLGVTVTGGGALN